MRIGEALTALVIRGIIFGFVVIAFTSASRSPAPASFSRASVGFAASVTVTLTLMLALAATVSHPISGAAALGLRGTI